MLEFLHIKNLALIEDIQLDFAQGMNVLTGETGAGKSFILKALNFVLGEKLDSSLVRPNAEKAEVQALFIHNKEEIILRRELIASTGRSRFFLNGHLTKQEEIKKISPSLILHASQHGQQKLLQASFQAKLIDEHLTEKEKESLLQVEELHLKLKQLAKYKENILKRIDELLDKRDFLESQQESIEKVSPLENEEEELEALRLEYRTFEKTEKLYAKGIELLRTEPSLLTSLSSLIRIVSQATEFDESFAQNLENLNSFTQEIHDIENKLRNPPAFISSSGEKHNIEAIESRLFELAQLKRKLRRSIKEIINLHEEIKENLAFLDSAELDLKQADKEEHALIEEMQKVLKTVNIARARAGLKFCDLLKNELKGLGFNEELEILPKLTKKEIWPAFQELEASVEEFYTLLFAPNPGQAPQALDKIASGGELSRFLLAITSLQAHSDLSLLIFDEVDAGIGGHTLNKVADRLSALAKKQQMLLITHWANLAKCASKHFLVEKEVIDKQTYTKCVALTNKEIEQELARMEGRQF